MNLDHPTAILIRDALRNQRIDVTDLKRSAWFIEEVNEKAAIFYARHNDRRDLKQVEFSTLLGELGEHAIYGLCKELGIDVLHNDEPFTKQFYWDLVINGELCEIKYKGKHDPFNFSFDDKEKDDQLFRFWRDYSFIISFYIKENDGRTYVIPWLLIDSDAIDQTRLHRDGLPLYRDSMKDKGRYLRQEAEELGLMARLNVNQNAFKFS